MKKCITTPLRFRAWSLVERAVEEGVRYGLNRAHKHTSKPDRSQVEECVAQAVMGELGEILDFGPEGDGA